MAPKKPRYNAALSREEQARQRLLENSGGEFDFSEEEVEPIVAADVQRMPEMDLTERVQRMPEMDLTERTERLARAVKAKTQPLEDSTIQNVVEGVSGIAKKAAEAPDELFQKGQDWSPLKKRFSDIATSLLLSAEKFPENSSERINLETQFAAAKAMQGDAENAKNNFIDVLQKAPNTKLPSNHPLIVKAYKDAVAELGIQENVEPALTPTPTPTEQVSQPAPVVPEVSPSAVASAAPVAPAQDVSPEQSRLAQLASILQGAGGIGGQQAPDARQQAIVDALGKAQQGLYAGLTRSQLPASFFAQAAPTTKPQEDQLTRLYKAAQIQQMLTPKGAELASDAAKQFLAKNAPELLEGVDIAALTQKDADRLMNLHAGGQKAKAQKELQDIRLKDANERAKERLNFAREQMDQRDYEFVTKQIAGGTKQAQAAVRALPALEQLFNEQLELDVKGGADFLSRAGAGALNDAEQRKFDMLYERIIAEDRKRLFGATLTGNELDTFNRISAQGPNVPMADKLEALRALMKGMQQELKAAFVPVEDKPAFMQFEAQSGISHRNPMFGAFDEKLRARSEGMPRTGAGGLKSGVSNIVEQGGSFLEELFGPSPAAPAPAPSPTAAPPLPTGQAVIEPERPQPKTEAQKKPLRRVEYQGKQGWYDTEKGVFISDEEMKALQSGTPMTVGPGR